MKQGEDTEVQFGCYLSPAEASDLTKYAASMEISRPKLCILLIVRELKCGRLATLPRSTEHALPKKRSKRVAARAIHPDVKIAFSEHAESYGLGTDEATAMLFRAELSERWLERSLSAWGNRP